MTVTGMPKGPKSSANRRAPGPDARAGVVIPRPGTGAIKATSAKTAPAASTGCATDRFSTGAPVFISAYSAPGGRTGATTVAVSRATAAVLTLKTASAPCAASAAPVAAATPSGRGAT